VNHRCTSLCTSKCTSRCTSCDDRLPPATPGTSSLRASGTAGRGRDRPGTPCSCRGLPPGSARAVRLIRARNADKISYAYDLGTCWEHEIQLAQTLPCDQGQDYPVCVAHKGDSPVEYWCEDDPEEP
jgi:hypothetical protein